MHQTCLESLERTYTHVRSIFAVTKGVFGDLTESAARDAAARIGRGAVGYACDMSVPTQIAALFDEVEATHGSVSVLVNNAGIAAPASAA